MCKAIIFKQFKDIKVEKMAVFNYYSMGVSVLLVELGCWVSNKLKTYVIHSLFYIYSIKFIYSFNFLSKVTNDVIIIRSSHNFCSIGNNDLNDYHIKYNLFRVYIFPYSHIFISIKNVN